MILIADSGSSKTDWRVLKNDGTISQAKTAGFNPYYQAPQQLEEEIKAVLIPQIDTSVTSIFYYGAGCSSNENKTVIQDVLQKYFKGAIVEVEHDLLAAARALCGIEPGIACILGTGVNSCLYDGDKIVDNVASLGYVLGDEGSGAYLGKKLLADYMRNDLPVTIREKFVKRFALEKDAILTEVYQGKTPTRFLAGFSRFIFQNIKDPYCYQLVYKSFETFFEKNVIKYKSYEKHKVHFTGSVAFYYSNILRQVANDRGVSVGNIVETPIAGLTLYHQKSISNT